MRIIQPIYLIKDTISEPGLNCTEPSLDDGKGKLSIGQPTCIG